MNHKTNKEYLQKAYVTSKIIKLIHINIPLISYKYVLIN